MDLAAGGNLFDKLLVAVLVAASRVWACPDLVATVKTTVSADVNGNCRILLCVYQRARTCACTYLFVCTHHMRICTYTCICIYVHFHIHIHECIDLVLRACSCPTYVACMCAWQGGCVYVFSGVGGAGH